MTLADKTFDYQCAVHEYTKQLLEYELDGGFWVLDPLDYNKMVHKRILILDCDCFKFLPSEWKNLSKEVVIKHQPVLSLCAGPLDQFMGTRPVDCII